MENIYIPKKFKIFAFQIILGMIQIIKSLQRPAGSLFLLLKKILTLPALGLFRLLIVWPYRLATTVRLKIQRWWPQINWQAVPYHHQIIIYLTIIGAVLISLNSWRIRSVEGEEFGQHNLLFPIIEQSGEISFSDQDSNIDTTPGFNVPIPADVPVILNSGGIVILKPTIITTEPGVAGRQRIETYTIRSGDTLYGLAARFGLNVTTLLWENRLTERSLLKLGQKISILPTDGVSYRIGRNDTLAKIASRFKVAAESINKFNQLGSKLTVGQTIIIPGGRPPATQVTIPIPTKTPTVTSPTPTKNINLPLPQGGGKLLWPTVHRRITQYFSWYHPGLDIADNLGTPLLAADDGIVEVAGWNRGGYGYYIIVDHGGGLKTLYGHSSKILVSVGDRVERGQQIANMGSTGRSTGPHLHFEVRLNGRRVNPLKYAK